jgi:hypothetical protein
MFHVEQKIYLFRALHYVFSYEIIASMNRESGNAERREANTTPAHVLGMA